MTKNTLNNLLISNILIFLLSLFIKINNINSAYITSHGFLVVTEKYQFTKKIFNRPACEGEILYPKYTSDAESVTMKVNEIISNFVEIYGVCNITDKSYSTKYATPESGDSNYFSIIWNSYKNNKIFRKDTINFMAYSGEEVDIIEDILNPLSYQMMHEFVKLSENILPKNIDWECFLKEIEKRNIQFFIENDNWYIIFNGTNKILVKKLPDFLLKDIQGDRELN